MKRINTCTKKKKKPSRLVLLALVVWGVSMLKPFLKPVGKSKREASKLKSWTCANFIICPCRVNVCDLPEKYESLKKDFEGKK